MGQTPLLRPHALGHGLLALAQKNYTYTARDKHVAEKAEGKRRDHERLSNLNECSIIGQTNILCRLAIAPPSSR
jgi:hypothetical protein